MNLKLFIGLLFLSISPFLQSCEKEIDGKDLFYQFYETYPNVISEATLNEPGKQNLKEAFRLYDLKQYPEAKAILSKVENFKEADFYLAIMEIEVEEPRKAEKLLLGINENQNHPFKTPAKYYLGLLALGENDLEKAKVYFSQLLGSEGYEALKKRATPEDEEL